ncbi:hypothetical protein CPC08DRAFT_439190 [Agrocybe pediades]|nr:hypothetical protein CPC08DRAFT_439190 [Agrocybe pediades]
MQLFYYSSYLVCAYLGLYIATIVIYSSNNSPHRRVVVACLILLFLAFLVQSCGQWHQTALVFVSVSETREDIFNLTVGLNDVSLPALGIVLTATNLISQILAGALLVWRCIYACDLSPIRLSALIILFIAEITLDFTTFVLDVLLDFIPKYQTDAHDRLYNKLLEASLFVTAATSILATFIIAYRIYASTARCKGSWKRYRYIVEIIVQSSAMYSVTALCFAIVASIDNAKLLQQQGTVLWNAAQYILAFTYIGPAAAPTLMVVRLAWAHNKSMTFSSMDDRSLSHPTNMISASRPLTCSCQKKTEKSAKGRAGK